MLIVLHAGIAIGLCVVTNNNNIGNIRTHHKTDISE